MVIKGLVFASLIFATGIAPALAKPTVIAELGSAPLLGTSISTAQMRDRIARNEGVVSAAAVKLGLTPGEYAQFHAAIESSRVAWVTVPRHLEAMTWQGGGKVYVLRDVIIPAGTHGWEVDVQSRDKVLALYMPAKCGNLSLVVKPAKVVARHPAEKLPVVASVIPAPPPVASDTVATVPVAAPPDDTPAAPVVVGDSEFPPAAVPARHTSALIFAPLLFGLAALSGGSGGSSGTMPVGCTCP